jgi:two-component system NtrC family sensor kinase
VPWLKWIRTISGRIVLGFAVLLTAFMLVAGYGIWQLQQFGLRLRFIRTAYLEIAPSVAQLQAQTSQFVDYLDEERLSRALMLKNRESRKGRINQILLKLDQIQDIPPQLADAVANDRRKAEEFRAEHEANEARFNTAFAGDRTSPEAREAREALRRSEEHLAALLPRLLDALQNGARTVTKLVERSPENARVGALTLGGAATGLAILVMIWVLATLRPLRRLRDGARQVARGEYRGRVAAGGGTEVAELAREFNAMAQAIEEREQELVRSARLAAVGKMAAVITHEVRNPLSSIGLNSELLAEELDRVAAGGSVTEAHQLLRAMQAEVDRLTGITEEYLRFARLPRPKLEREKLGDLVRQLVEFCRGDLESRGIAIDLDVGDGGPELAVDEAQLRQACLNLVRNAGEAMPAGGRLAVSVKPVGQGAEIAIADTGAGIPEADLPRIFEPFFSTKAAGTGLGLALTQEIIHEHGGKIAVSSSPGGTTFRISLGAA